MPARAVLQEHELCYETHRVGCVTSAPKTSKHFQKRRASNDSSGYMRLPDITRSWALDLNMCGQESSLKTTLLYAKSTDIAQRMDNSP